MPASSSSAQDDGIKVLQVNMPSATTTDSYVGNDWVSLGEEEAKAPSLIARRAKAPRPRSPSCKGSSTGAANIYLMRRDQQRARANPELQLVSEQAANYDPAKARAIMATVLQQIPDLCGVIGIWDNADVGIGAAVRPPAKPARSSLLQLAPATSPLATMLRKACSMASATIRRHPGRSCGPANLPSSWKARARPASDKVFFFGPITRINKDTIDPRNCWTIDDLK